MARANQARPHKVTPAEVGADTTRFPDATHLIFWAGLCPRNDESASKCRRTRVRKSGIWLKTALVTAAWAACGQNHVPARSASAHQGKTWSKEHHSRSRRFHTDLPRVSRMLSDALTMQTPAPTTSAVSTTPANPSDSMAGASCVSSHFWASNSQRKCVSAPRFSRRFRDLS